MFFTSWQKGSGCLALLTKGLSLLLYTYASAPNPLGVYLSLLPFLCADGICWSTENQLNSTEIGGVFLLGCFFLELGLGQD